MRSRHVSPALTRTLIAALVLVVGLIVTQLWAAHLLQMQAEDNAAAARSQSNQFRNNVEAGALPAYYLAHALDLYIRNRDGVVQEAPTNRFLLGLYEHSQFVRLVTVAPGNRVTYLQPTEGNEAAKGLYFPDIAEQWPAIRDIIESGQPRLVGPISLVQGGTGIAYRLPIFLSKDNYWGIVNTVLDSDEFVSNAAATSGLQPANAAIRALNSDGSPGEAFWGDPAVFGRTPALTNVTAHGANWEVGVATAPVNAALVRPTWIVGTLMSLALAVMTFLLLWGRQRRTETVAHLNALSRHAPGMLFQFKVKRGDRGTFIYVSDGVREMFGLEPKDVLRDGALLWSRMGRHERDQLLGQIFDAADAHRGWHQRIQMRDADGETRWYLADASPQSTGADTYLWHGLLSDVTNEVRGEEHLRVSASVFDSTHDGVVIMDPHGSAIDVNPAFTALTGFGLDDLAGRSALDALGSGLTSEAAFADLHSSIARHGFWRGEFIHRTKDGDVASRPVAVSAILDDSGELAQSVAVFGSLNPVIDDVVTGLPSRRVFEDRLSQAVDKANASAGKVALIVLGIDSFRDVNEAHGHRFGDIVLKEIGDRLRAAVPDSETVARLSGDEFGVILAQPADVADVEQVASGIVQCFTVPFGIGDVSVLLTTSLGISVFPDDTNSAFGLSANAHQALRVAKEEGRDRSIYFTPQMQVEAHARTRLIDDLRAGLSRGELHIEFQPVVTLPEGGVTKAEALIRWTHPQRGLIAPMEFIPLAERAGLIKEIGDFVFTETLATVRRAREHCPQFQISFNMSPVEIADAHHLHADRLASLDQQCVPGSALVVEITEGVLLDRSAMTATNLRLYRDAGMQFAIDDFGTGYSSLAYLQQLDVDYLKIDREFIKGLPTDSDGYSLCRAMIEMAHSLDLKVIGEGIETIEQRDALAGLGCDYGQGFLFARPVRADALLALLGEADGGAQGAGRAAEIDGHPPVV